MATKFKQKSAKIALISHVQEIEKFFLLIVGFSGSVMLSEFSREQRELP